MTPLLYKAPPDNNEVKNCHPVSSTPFVFGKGYGEGCVETVSTAHDSE